MLVNWDLLLSSEDIMIVSATPMAFGDDDRKAHPDQSVNLAVFVAAAETALYESRFGSPEYQHGETALSLAEPVFAAARPTSIRGVLLKLRYCHRHIRALAGASHGTRIARTAPALLSATRKLARREPDAVASLGEAASTCRAALDRPNTWVSQDHRAVLSLHLEMAVEGLAEIRPPQTRRPR